MEERKETGEVLVEAVDLSFQYRAQSEPTLKHVNFTIRAGEKVLIVGPSGCGKSTLAGCLNGLIPFSYEGKMEGSLKVKGKETRELGIFGLSRVIGTILQDSDAQFVGMTVAEDIAFALENDFTPGPEMKERVARAASLVGLEGHLFHAPQDLSGGQKQRTSLAGVLVGDVELMLFDEPLANLDPATGRTAMELIDRMRDETGAAMVIIEHRLEDVLWRQMDRIILMREGEIVMDAPPDELLSCSLLSENGIREPLYLTALRYAGVKIRESLHPSRVRDLRLTQEEKEAVRSWAAACPAGKGDGRGEEVLRAEHLCFSYEKGGRQVLSDVSVRFYRGELVAIVGTNGAGKSTFSKVLCGLERQQEGRFIFAGVEDWEALSIKERANWVGYVMQSPGQMISQVKIFDEIALGLRLRGVNEEEIQTRVYAAMRTCGLYEMRNWPVSALSFGQKKRVTIASILVLNPAMIILDEPTAGQDYRHYTEIMEFLKELARGGVCVVMITHDMHLMLEYASRSIVFSDGRIIADAPSYEVLTDSSVIQEASLKETSLYDLSRACEVEDAPGFVRGFIAYEEEKHRDSSGKEGI